jgi:hypothetical protein
MKMFKDRFSKFFIMLLFILITSLVSCSQLGELRFCEKSENADTVPTNCGSKFTVGEISIVLNHRENIDTETINLKFYNLQISDKLPDNIVEVKSDPESQTVVGQVEIYNPGNYRVVAERPDGEILGRGDLAVIDVE